MKGVELPTIPIDFAVAERFKAPSEQGTLASISASLA